MGPHGRRACRLVNAATATSCVRLDSHTARRVRKRALVSWSSRRPGRRSPRHAGTKRENEQSAVPRTAPPAACHQFAKSPHAQPVQQARTHVPRNHASERPHRHHNIHADTQTHAASAATPSQTYAPGVQLAPRRARCGAGWLAPQRPPRPRSALRRHPRRRRRRRRRGLDRQGPHRRQGRHAAVWQPPSPPSPTHWASPATAPPPPPAPPASASTRRAGRAWRAAHGGWCGRPTRGPGPPTPAAGAAHARLTRSQWAGVGNGVGASVDRDGGA